ncbi:hypothetical protein PIB30_028874 [Stylosanthes scabra]|uniref:Uncharacterized protein n=1 Tax=Stylosanthes scabra TaxID=79078 RepID=A0ABU6X8N8_9FABA|nr:hypothetical protein [Stylosanthes scabra]
MASQQQQGSRCEIELVIERTTTSHHNNNNNNNHENSSTNKMTIIAKHSILMSLNSVLTKFHAGYFRISLSLGGQALLWKTLTSGPATDDKNNVLRRVFHALNPTVFPILWG